MFASGGSSVATTSIVNGFSSSGVAPNFISFSSIRGTKVNVSGALTSNTLATVLNITGTAGSMSQLAVSTVDGAARTIRVKVTIDGSGTATFDATSASVAASNYGVIVAGVTDTSASPLLVDGYPIKWKTSCLVEVASSVTETAKFNIGYRYHLES
jgi:hypothetical protein